MFAAFIAGAEALLENPLVTAAAKAAFQALIDWWHALGEEDKAAIEAEMQAARTAAVGQLNVFDAALAAFRKHLDTLAAHEDEKVNAAGKAIEEEIRARAAEPLPAPQIVDTASER